MSGRYVPATGASMCPPHEEQGRALPPGHIGARGEPWHGRAVNHRTLGRTGIQVSPLCLGTMMLGAWGNTDPGECERIVAGALDAGINMIDTADVYAFGESEEIVEAQWVSERRNRERFSTEQLSYSILARHAEAAALPVAERYTLGVLVWSPLNGGWLTGKYRRDTPPP